MLNIDYIILMFTFILKLYNVQHVSIMFNLVSTDLITFATTGIIFTNFSIKYNVKLFEKKLNSYLEIYNLQK